MRFTVKFDKPVIEPSGIAREYGETPKNKNICYYTKLFNKLGQIEDVEEQLGIDLITLFKLFQIDKVWVYGNVGVLEAHIDNISISTKRIELWNGVSHLSYLLEDYGKSFALTKEELL